MKRGKNYNSAVEKRGEEKMTADEVVAFVKENASAKFDESIEVHIRLNIDPKKGEQSVRGSVTLPHGTGKEVRIGVITEDKADEAKKAGADLIGGQELIDKIKKGELPDVDVLVATPDMMPKLAPAARVLGPRGLMPSPKTDTVTPNVADAIDSLKKGKANFKNDNTGNIHQVIGKVSFTQEQIVENYNAFMDAVKACKSDAHKGKLIATKSMCSTMGPAVKIK
ncbi:MAG: 50S ribosomal protein L1 [Patescibacteria group bacterium]|nr:50S ribosomal protein L1 [Patescibacteria group bacterium]